jgi:ribosomal protein S18 acetylase RimI-like enzyme
MTEIIIRTVTEADLDACYHIETNAFPPAEAATREKIAKRIHLFPQGFLVAEIDDKLVGMVNSGATNQADMTGAELKDLVGFDADGKNVAIFSVSVLPDYRGRGIATRLMQRFIADCRHMKKAKLLLLCKTELIPMYEKFGFVDDGESESSYAGESWHEMTLALDEQA